MRSCAGMDSMLTSCQPGRPSGGKPPRLTGVAKRRIDHRVPDSRGYWALGSMGSPSNCSRRRWVPFTQVQKGCPPSHAGCGQLTERASDTRPKGAPMPVIRHDSPHQTLTARLRAAGCVFAEDEARLLIDAAPTPAALDEMARRRVAGLPLEHILGWAEFCGLRIVVDTGVFVPRRRTEFLVRQAAALLDDLAPRARQGQPPRTGRC